MISALITASIDLLADKAGGLGDSLNKFDATTNHLRDTQKPSQVELNVFSPKGSDDEPLGWSSCNTSAMWVGERLKNGGMANMSQGDNDGRSSSSSQEGLDR